MLPKLYLFLLVVSIFFGGLVLRCTQEHAHHLGLARRAIENAEYTQAFAEYRQALAWEVFGGNDLENLKSEFKVVLKREDLDSSIRLLGLYEFKRGLLSSRSFLSPRNETDPEIADLNRQISDLQNTDFGNKLVDLNKSPETIVWQLLIQLLFWCWIGSALALVWKGFSSNGSPKLKPLLRLAPMTLSFFIAWVLCLAQ